MRFLVARRCVELTPLCPAGHLPLKGGDRQEALLLLHSQALRWARPCRRSISPLEGEMPGRAEGGKLHAPPFTPEKASKTQQLHPAQRCRSGIPSVRRAIARLRFGWGWCGSDALRSRVFHHAVFRKGPCTACCEMVLSTNVASVPTTGPSLGFRHVWQPPGRTAFTLTARRGAGKSGDDFFRLQSSLRVT
ncbi:hypothetical protein J2S88_000899 [Agrobacterium tumefaciens]|nr:hypothetical protein [Agrobacterium tumefaciens]MDP9871991.1 hypothetical protein [Agrobacterium tumefaciens]MDP9976288.1 hypothetical protein [Agrobacterium tumefaciens]